MFKVVTPPFADSEVHPAMVTQYPPIMHGNQSDNASGAALLQQFPQSGGIQNRHDKSVYDQGQGRIQDFRKGGGLLNE